MPKKLHFSGGDQYFQISLGSLLSSVFLTGIENIYLLAREAYIRTGEAVFGQRVHDSFEASYINLVNHWKIFETTFTTQLNEWNQITYLQSWLFQTI